MVQYRNGRDWHGLPIRSIGFANGSGKKSDNACESTFALAEQDPLNSAECALLFRTLPETIALAGFRSCNGDGIRLPIPFGTIRY
jgi:hypothetical protein